LFAFSFTALFCAETTEQRGYLAFKLKNTKLIKRVEGLQEAAKQFHKYNRNPFGFPKFSRMLPKFFVQCSPGIWPSRNLKM
ncbi:hypothetical protein PFISCL1PPCAC_25875, partial [Pristionchus fissidentatus]